VPLIYGVLYNTVTVNAKKEELMIKWIRNLFKLEKTTPYIPRNTFPRIKALDSRIAAARGIKPVKANR
tara:strand:- start:198 stop:401 length:204 start_codon:yes stop_codon:yes gene_type:complete